MTNRERVRTTLGGGIADRLPMIEWASWWRQTVDSWRGEDSACPTGRQELYDWYGLDRIHQCWLPSSAGLPKPARHGAPVINSRDDFLRILPNLFPEKNLEAFREKLILLKEGHDAGDYAVWYTFDGFFWFPRKLFGIENHFYAFYDQPELMHEMNHLLCEYLKKSLRIIREIMTPEFMTFAEDMSYNHGPMLSREAFNEFMAPYYAELIPEIKAQGTRVLIDTDGDVEPLIPWFIDAGIEGVLPLERQAGVDVCRIRKNYPDWIMIGGFDKTVMSRGEDAVRAEFERILPAMRSGKYIPSVDHQTPPDVSIEDYRRYVKILAEYCGRAMVYTDFN